jgi:hypothetical protein
MGRALVNVINSGTYVENDSSFQEAFTAADVPLGFSGFSNRLKCYRPQTTGKDDLAHFRMMQIMWLDNAPLTKPYYGPHAV